MKHVHCWRVQTHLLLSLPSTAGYSDRFTQWRCQTCGLWWQVAGEIRHGFPLETPEFWSRAEAEQARRDVARLHSPTGPSQQRSRR
jgi:hypothetical protein